MPSHRDILAVAVVGSAGLTTASAGQVEARAEGATPDLRGRLRQPGPSVPTEVEPPRVHQKDAAASLRGARLVTLYDEANWSEGPVWWRTERTLVWSDVVGRRVLGWREDGAVDVLVDATPFINGNAVDPDGTLVHCEHGRRISRSDRDGRLTALATRVEGSSLNSPNDIVLGPDGALWFSDPTFGLDNPQQGVPARSDSGVTAICRIAPSEAEARRVVEMVQPNGLGFSPNGRTFYASQTPEHGEGEVAIFAFDHEDSQLSRRRRFATVLTGIPDGFAVDRRGWLWSSSGAGIEVFDAGSRHLATVPTPHLCSNCAFDAEQRRLFVTDKESLWMMELAA